jgi:GntR family transcriptional repressor for pyruvate dehydrogenase complex
MLDEKRRGAAGTSDRRRVFEDVCELIRAEIANGTLQPGNKLPAERQMAERYKVGRNAVREALRTLEIAGVVRLQKGRNGGPYLRAPSPSRVTHAISDLIDYGSLGWKDLTEARSLVLEIVMRLAAERGTSADFDLIERNLDLTEDKLREGAVDAWTERAYEFYPLLAQCTHNSVLVLLLTSMSDLLRSFVNTASKDEELTPLLGLVPARRKMLKSLRAGAVDEATSELKRQLRQIHIRIYERIARLESSGNAVPSAATQARKLAELEAENQRLRQSLAASEFQAKGATKRKSSDRPPNSPRKSAGAVSG